MMLCYPWVSCKAGACCPLFSYWGCGQVFHYYVNWWILNADIQTAELPYLISDYAVYGC